MRSVEGSLPTGRTLVALDVAAAAWTVAWIVVGILVANTVDDLTQLSGTVEEVGADVQSAGGALGALGELPLLGDAFAEALQVPAEAIQEAGLTARQGGASSTGTIETLSALLGVTIALIPSLPVLAAYLPARLARSREVRALLDARRRAGDDPAFQELLARRAAHHLSYHRLARVSPEPWNDLAAGRFDRLARAELERLGIER